MPFSMSSVCVMAVIAMPTSELGSDRFCAGTMISSTDSGCAPASAVFDAGAASARWACAGGAATATPTEGLLAQAQLGLTLGDPPNCPAADSYSDTTSP